MGNSLLDIQPHVVSRDLRGYSVFIYGEPKVGKTTIASHFPGALLLAFEKGYSAIPGVRAKVINSWSEFKKTNNELKDPKVKEIYQNVIIDTSDIAYAYCKKYICDKESTDQVTYEHIKDIPYGAGYDLAANEFDEGLRKILQMGYGLILISHSQDKTFKDEHEKEYDQIIPTLDKKARLVCERTCDIIGYARSVETEEGLKRKLFLRGTPRFVAGSRFKFIEPVIDFNYESLVNALGDAIDKEAAESGFNTTNDRENLHTEEKYDFQQLKTEFKDIVQELIQKNSSNSSVITETVEHYLGKGRKVNDCTEAQAEQLNFIVLELKQIINK